MNKKKIALVTGSAGQDGSYLCEFLLEKKYTVIAADRRSSRDNGWRHKELGIQKKLVYEDFDLSDINSIISLFRKYKFKEIYNLAAQSFVGSSFTTPIYTADVTGLGPLRILESIKNFSPTTKFYQASSSEMYGRVSIKILDENSKFNPRSPYAISKLFAHEITKNYRESYNLFCCSGILFNHESPLRGEEFVTRKITKQLCEIKLGHREHLELGNIYAKRDWGHAKDYVRAMWLMLQQKKPSDYVIATNQVCSVKYFINQCLNYLNIPYKWKGNGAKEICINSFNNKIIIKINPKYYRPAEVDYLRGSYIKAKKILKWTPRNNLSELLKEMINQDLKRLS
jgi:GDPmannose 4,6-dehydratase